MNSRWMKPAGQSEVTDYLAFMPSDRSIHASARALKRCESQRKLVRRGGLLDYSDSGSEQCSLPGFTGGLQGTPPGAAHDESGRSSDAPRSRRREGPLSVRNR